MELLDYILYNAASERKPKNMNEDKKLSERFSHCVLCVCMCVYVYLYTSTAIP